MNENLAIAETIFNQLGRNKFRAMTGANHFSAGSDGSLYFHVPQKAKKLIVKIRLTPADVYEMTFTYFRAMKLLHEVKINDVYCDQLCSVFEKQTGLYTSL